MDDADYSEWITELQDEIKTLKARIAELEQGGLKCELCDGIGYYEGGTRDGEPCRICNAKHRLQDP
jgi:recombinational DNA repair protein RecR